MNHPLSCRRGALRGHVTEPDRVRRGVCYCKDCQAFAHFLGHPGDILDDLGGTDVISTRHKSVVFTEVKVLTAEELAAVRAAVG